MHKVQVTSHHNFKICLTWLEARAWVAVSIAEASATEEVNLLETR